jgi:hypothetical protein
MAHAVLKNFSEARLSNAQDRVLAGYRERFKLTNVQADNLHMFFSPHRIPRGLLWEEVCIVLYLYERRDADRMKQFTLPFEWRNGKRMLRRAFKKGLYAFLKKNALPTELQN